MRRLSIIAGTLLAATACGQSEPPEKPERPPGVFSSPDTGPASEGVGGGSSINVMVVDDPETGARYDALGRSLGDGQPDLTPLVGYNQFWFAWAAFRPGSSVFGSDVPVAGSLPAADDGCALPCDAHIPGGPPKGVGSQGIPALTSPEMVAASAEGAAYLTDRSYVVGVAAPGDVRAYPHNIFWWHEIVNDHVGGAPIAITHCPLTFSSIAHDPTRFTDGATYELGVSGKLLLSNLVFFVRGEPNGREYDAATPELVFSQLLGVATGTFADDGAFAPIVTHPDVGQPAPRLPVFEMTWGAWRTFFPDTLVVSDDTGFARTYTESGYPYGSYFTNEDTFGTSFEDRRFGAKEIVYGVVLGDEARAYPHAALAEWAEAEQGTSETPRGVLMDTIGTTPVAIVFDLSAGYVQAFEAPAEGALEVSL